MNIYQMLAVELRGDGISEEKKEGILRGMELMGLQTEKWFDNEEHANSYRNDTVEGCGFSGWKETVEFTRGFLDTKQPESDENEGDSMYVEDESDISDMELTDGEDDDEEEDDCDDEEDDWNQWDNFIYEGVTYMIGPGENNTKVVLDVDNYHQVGIIVDMESGDPAITFEDNATYENHMEKVREITVPEDGKEAVQFLLKFIQNNYPKLNLCPEEGVETSVRSFPFESKHGPMFVLENYKDENGRDFGLMTPHPKGWREGSCGKKESNGYNYHIWKSYLVNNSHHGYYRYTQSQKDCPSDLTYDPRGKKMGEVMKVIEKAL